MLKQEVISIQAHGRCIHKKKNYYKTSCITSSERTDFIRPYPYAMLLFTDAMLFYLHIFHKQEQFHETHLGLFFLFSVSLTLRDFCSALIVIQGFLHDSRVDILYVESLLLPHSVFRHKHKHTLQSISGSTAGALHDNPQCIFAPVP